MPTLTARELEEWEGAGEAEIAAEELKDWVDYEGLDEFANRECFSF